MSTSENSALSPDQKIEKNDDLPTLIASFKEDYERADQFCKIVQQYRDQAGIPAINEMRYAGYHLSLAYGVDGSLSSAVQIRRARAHAQRAIYEASEAGILQALREIDAFRTTFKAVPITDVVKDWIDILAYSKNAQSRLGAKRESGDDRILDHDKHFEIFSKLSEYTDRLKNF